VTTQQRHILVYEPRTEGHHLGWLRFITEDLLSGGYKLTLAVDGDPKLEQRFKDHLGDYWNEVTWMDISRIVGNSKGTGQKISTVAACLEASGAERVFLCALDEVASNLWRSATFGALPPKPLRGRMGGIYHRPRFMEASMTSATRWFKPRGFKRLLEEGWFGQILFVDEYLTRRLQADHPGAPVSFLCDPCPPMEDISVTTAREQLKVPEHFRVFLFYGGGYRRKGLHLAVEAMLKLSRDIPAYLLCAGHLKPEGQTARGLDQLISQNRARLIDRYVTDAEEQLCFAASNAVLLPYIHHFGTSGVLSRAMASGRMVIVSDEELLGRLTREYHLGMLFPTENAAALGECLKTAAYMDSVETDRYQESAGIYATKYSRPSYRKALLEAMDKPVISIP